MTFVFVTIAVALYAFGNHDGAAFIARLALPVAVVEASVTVRGALTVSSLLRDRKKQRQEESGKE